MYDSSLKFGKLLRSGCVTLRELNIRHMLNNEEDRNCFNQLVPQLESYVVDSYSSSPEFPEQELTSMTRLKFLNFKTERSLSKVLERHTFPHLSQLDIMGSFCGFTDVFESWKLPNLTELSLSGRQDDHGMFTMLSKSEVVLNLHYLNITDFQVRGKLFCLFSGRKGFPHLKSLALRNGDLFSQDLRCLAQASVDGLLPSLTHLDLSENPNMDNLRYLFALDCKWEKLKALKVDRKQESSCNRSFDFEVLTRLAQSGCLQVLEQIHFYTHVRDFLPKGSYTRCWRHLCSMEVSSYHQLTHKDILGPLAAAVEQGFLPALKFISLCGGSSEGARPRVSVSKEKQRLRVKGVNVSFITRGDHW